MKSKGSVIALILLSGLLIYINLILKKHNKIHIQTQNIGKYSTPYLLAPINSNKLFLYII